MGAERPMIRIHFTRTLLREAYDNLTERAKLDLDFLLLTVAAAVICALGFKMNSTSVIVGAMVISPLLYPVICVGATTYQRDWNSLARAIGTFAIGALAAIAAAAAVNVLHAATVQSEIADRLAAAPVDYFLVAFFSGIAGTYAFFSPKIHEAIAGIAISVALIPPVVMLGIALAERSTDLFLASGTIVLCNVFGIYLGSFVMVVALHWISGR
jgi:uncharacterized hydrophobic protein (TIGR00271 family)